MKEECAIMIFTESITFVKSPFVSNAAADGASDGGFNTKLT